MPFDAHDNKVLTKKLEEALKVKHATARVYASSIRQLATLMKIEFKDADIQWLTKRKVVNYLNNVVNLTWRMEQCLALNSSEIKRSYQTIGKSLCRPIKTTKVF